MDVTLLFKWGHDYDDAYVSSDGSFRFKRGKLVASDDDAAAIASAREVAAASGGELKAATIGSGDASWAAARGAAKVVSADDATPVPDDRAQAEELFGLLEKAGRADLVVIADSCDYAGVAPALAAMLQVPYIAEVREFKVDEADPGRIVAQRVEGNVVETIAFGTPAVVSVKAVASEKTVPTMKQMLAARKVPLEKAAGLAEAASPVETLAVNQAETKRARMFEGSPAEAAAALVGALKQDNVL